MVNSANLQVTVSAEGLADDVGEAVRGLFSRQSGFAPPAQSVPNAATVQVGSVRTPVEVQSGDTVESLFRRASGLLGIDPTRSVTLLRGGSVIPGSTPAVAGETYCAVPNLDPKG